MLKYIGIKMLKNFLNWIFKKYDEYKQECQENSDCSSNVEPLNIATSEEIEINIDFNYCNLLMYLFPKTFFSEKEANDFYEEFCRKAKEFNEAENVYKLPENIRLTYKIDMISNLVYTWNSYNKSPETNIYFWILPFEEIKNENLKNEIKLMYEENFEHLKNLEAASKFSNGNIYSTTNFVVNIRGIFKSTNLTPDFKENNSLWNKETDNFYLPIETIIDNFRKIETNKSMVVQSELSKIKNNLEKKYESYKFEINFDEYEAHLKNEMFSAIISTKYFYPLENIKESFEGVNLTYRQVDIYNI